MSIAFAMSEHLGLDTLILNIPVISANIQGFCFSHLAENGHPGSLICFPINAPGMGVAPLNVKIVKCEKPNNR